MPGAPVSSVRSARLANEAARSATPKPLLAIFLGVIPDDFFVKPVLGTNRGEALLNVRYLVQVSGDVAF